MSLLDELRARREEILAIAARCGVTDVRVFGSVAREEEEENSDVDFLVRRASSTPVGLKLYEFPAEMEKLLGRKVDFVLEPTLHWVIRDDVLREAKPL